MHTNESHIIEVIYDTLFNNTQNEQFKSLLPYITEQEVDNTNARITMTFENGKSYTLLISQNN